MVDKLLLIIFQNKLLYLNRETQLSLFDCYITSNIYHASEIRGFHKANAAKRVHLDFCPEIYKQHFDLC